MAVPSIINTWNRGAMRRIRSFPDDERMRVLDEIPRRDQNAIARARSDEWIDIEHAIAVCDALVEILGAARTVEFWSGMVYDSWVGGLLEPLAGGLQDEDEDDSGRRRAVLTLAPLAWSMSVRDCGEIEISSDEQDRLRLDARDLPPMVRVSPGIRIMYAGALRAMLEFSRTRASVESIDDGERLAFSLTPKGC